MGVNFISVSGVSNEEELFEIEDIVNRNFLPANVVIGYQLSNKSINHGTATPIQPFFDQIGELVQHTRNFGIPAIHYFTKDPSTVISDVEKIAQQGVLDNEPVLIQLNTLPLAPEVLQRVKQIGFNIIFPVAVADKKSGGYAVWKGKGVEDMTSGNVDSLVRQVLERKDFIDYAMFDPSHGIGTELDLSQGSLAIRFGQAVRASPELHHIGLDYAGGIGPDNASSVVRGLTGFFPKGFSIDTQRKVRIDDVLSPALVEKYLLEATQSGLGI